MSRPVTLIEMLVVMALLSVAAGLIGLKGYKAVARQRARSQAEVLVSRLNLEQRQALAAGQQANSTTGDIRCGDSYIHLPGHFRKLTLSTTPHPEIPDEAPSYPHP